MIVPYRFPRSKTGVEVMRKPSETPLAADDYQLSVMTCVNYLKLPDYSGREVMAERMRVAMLEGVGSFHLS